MSKTKWSWKNFKIAFCNAWLFITLPAIILFRVWPFSHWITTSLVLAISVFIYIRNTKESMNNYALVAKLLGSIIGAGLACVLFLKFIY